MKMELIECSETSAIRTQTPGNRPKENILHIEHGESLKTKILYQLTGIVSDSYIAPSDIAPPSLSALESL